MKNRILAGAAVLGLSVLFAGIGPVFAGGNDPQEHQALQQENQTMPYEEAMETGTLPPSEAEKQAAETDVRSGSQAGGTKVLDVDPRWKESGG